MAVLRPAWQQEQPHESRRGGKRVGVEVCLLKKFILWNYQQKHFFVTI